MNPRSGGTIKVTCENAFPVSRMHRNNMGAVEMRDSGCGWYKIVAILALPAFLAACEQQAEVPEAAARQVRSIVIEKRQAAEDLTLTGRIEAEDEVPLAFRISGRVLENNGKLGARVTAGDLVARLESQNEENQLRADTAALAAAEAQYNQARGHYERQSTLFRQGWATRATFEVAEKGMKTAASQVEAAQARLSAAEDLLGFTELRADKDGVLTAVGPSAGEVVQAGQMIVRVAQGGWPRRGVRRSRTGHSQFTGRHRDHGGARRRSLGQRARHGARGGATGRPGDAHVQSQGQS
jgi:multidrug efflux pump subunit AcrA (membrane-fusion protein)